MANYEGMQEQYYDAKAQVGYEKDIKLFMDLLRRSNVNEKDYKEDIELFCDYKKNIYALDAISRKYNEMNRKVEELGEKYNKESNNARARAIMGEITKIEAKQKALLNAYNFYETKRRLLKDEAERVESSIRQRANKKETTIKGPKGPQTGKKR